MTDQDPETWMAQRLQSHGVDIYDGGEFVTFRDRLAHAIVTNRFGLVVAGRHNGRPENYDQLFERMYGLKPQDVVRQANLSERVAS